MYTNLILGILLGSMPLAAKLLPLGCSESGHWLQVSAENLDAVYPHAPHPGQIHLDIYLACEVFISTFLPLLAQSHYLFFFFLVASNSILDTFL